MVQIFIFHVNEVFEKCLAELLLLGSVVEPPAENEEQDFEMAEEEESENDILSNVSKDDVPRQKEQIKAIEDGVAKKKLLEEKNDIETMEINEQEYNIIGTLSNLEDNLELPRLTIIPEDEHKAMKYALSNSDVIIYRARSLNDLGNVMYALKILQSSPHKSCSFILISNIITWIKTSKFIDEANQEYEPYHEDASITRKTSEKYSKFLEIEKYVKKLHSEQLNTFVVCCGLLYGQGEECFRLFFKMACDRNISTLPCIKEGTNYIPMIHVTDLCTIIKFMIDSMNTELKRLIDHRYIVAVDNSYTTLKDIVVAIAEVYGKSNELEYLERIEALTSEYLDFLQVDMKFEKEVTKQWRISLPYIEGFAANIKKIKTEFEFRLNITLQKEKEIAQEEISEQDEKAAETQEKEETPDEQEAEISESGIDEGEPSQEEITMEEEILALRSKPLQRYLIDSIGPVLVRGLIDVGITRPEDPVSHLAKYLLEHKTL